MELLNEIYTTEGRLNRWRYFKCQIIWVLISAVVGAILGFIGGLLSGNAESLLVTVPTGMWSFAAGIGSIMLGIRRLHDLNKSGWFMLLLLIPLINLVFALYVYLAPGQVGANKYGADPLEEN